mgnify:CR=1 FL=1
MHLFYDPNIEQSTVSYQMNETESRHACKVLRLKEGDVVKAAILRAGKAQTIDIKIPKKINSADL